jgi:hypothetical protein
LAQNIGLAPHGSCTACGQPKKKDITTSSLLPDYRNRFADRYIPLIRDFTGTMQPWEQPDAGDIRNTFYQVFEPESQLIGDLFIIVSKLVHAGLWFRDALIVVPADR